MILLEDGNNTFDVTVTENSVLALPEYLFVFINKNTKVKTACTSTNTSTNTQRYDRFSIIVGANDPLNGKVLLDDYGMYDYYIYEKTAAQIAAFDYTTAGLEALDIRTITGQVEEGFMKYKTSDQTYTSYKDLSSSVKTYGN